MPLLERLTTKGVVRGDGTDEVVDAVQCATGDRANLHYLAADAVGDDLWRANRRGLRPHDEAPSTSASYASAASPRATPRVVADPTPHPGTRSLAARLDQATTPERTQPWPAALSH